MNRFRIYIVTSTLLLSIVMHGWAQSYMFVQLNTGDVVYYYLAERPIVSYSGTELIVQSESSIKNHFPLNNVRNLTYTSPITTPIEEDIIFNYPIQVYSISGHYITTLEQVEDTYSMEIPYGIYILRSQKSSKKILIQ